jgi:hypothetical protein
VEWEPTAKNNVKVLNDTGDFYRFFDATPHAEFLYACVRQTIEQDLPNETKYLQNFDSFKSGVENLVDMPERTLNNLLGFLRQNGGKLSRRAKENEFAELTAEEVLEIEKLYSSSFSEAGAAKAGP